MNKAVFLIATGLLFATLIVPAAPAAACGWEFTCNTEEWAEAEANEAWQCVREVNIEASCAPDFY